MEAVLVLQKVLKEAIRTKFPNVSMSDQLLEEPRDEMFGDYATSIPLKISKDLRAPPRKIAEEIIAALKLPKEFSKAEIAGAGFINFSFSDEYLLQTLDVVISDGENFGKPAIGKGKTVVTDISHPNVAKPMGAHHLLPTVIGDSVNRILAHAGYKVVRDNYLGDWGTQFGKLIYAYRTWGNAKTVEKNPIPELLKLYVRFHEEADKNPLLEEEGRKEFKKLEQGDAENKKLWKWTVELSLKEFHKTWDLLGVKFDVIHGESFYQEKMAEILALGIKNKVFIEGERGALICEFPDKGYPVAIVRKGDGSTLYATRDLARVKYWEDTWHPDIMLNVVDAAQKLYFQQLFAMALKLKLTDAEQVHASFGRMRFPDSRMSTRKGNIVLLEELVDETIELAREIVDKKNPDLSERKKTDVSRQVGIGALKFVVLNQNREHDVTFTWEKMLSIEGESAPYLQYVYARCAGILRKAAGGEAAGGETTGGETGVGRTAGRAAGLEAEERNLLRLFPKFHKIIVNAAVEYRPDFISRFMLRIAAAFNVFYDRHPVLQAPAGIREKRIAIVSAVSQILKNGLALLGIEMPERM